MTLFTNFQRRIETVTGIIEKRANQHSHVSETLHCYFKFVRGFVWFLKAVGAKGVRNCSIVYIRLFMRSQTLTLVMIIKIIKP